MIITDPFQDNNTIIFSNEDFSQALIFHGLGGRRRTRTASAPSLIMPHR